MSAAVDTRRSRSKGRGTKRKERQVNDDEVDADVNDNDDDNNNTKPPPPDELKRTRSRSRSRRRLSQSGIPKTPAKQPVKTSSTDAADTIQQRNARTIALSNAFLPDFLFRIVPLILLATVSTAILLVSAHSAKRQSMLSHAFHIINSLRTSYVALVAAAARYVAPPIFAQLILHGAIKAAVLYQKPANAALILSVTNAIAMTAFVWTHDGMEETYFAMYAALFMADWAASAYLRGAPSMIHHTYTSLLVLLIPLVILHIAADHSVISPALLQVVAALLRADALITLTTYLCRTLPTFVHLTDKSGVHEVLLLITVIFITIRFLVFLGTTITFYQLLANVWIFSINSHTDLLQVIIIFILSSAFFIHATSEIYENFIEEKLIEILLPINLQTTTIDTVVPKRRKSTSSVERL